MATRTFDVERMQANDRSAVVGALARAFYDDPLFNHFVPDRISQTKGLLTFMGSGVTDATPSERSGSHAPTARSRARPCGSLPAHTRGASAATC